MVTMRMTQTTIQRLIKSGVNITYISKDPTDTTFLNETWYDVSAPQWLNLAVRQYQEMQGYSDLSIDDYVDKMRPKTTQEESSEVKPGENNEEVKPR